MEIVKAEDPYHFALCIYLRTVIFIIGQKVAWEDEIIEGEDSQAVSFVGFVENEPVATARYRVVGGETGKIERVGVLPEHQGKGYGRAMISHLISELKNNYNLKSLKLGAQDHAIPFYKKLGFEVEGDGFMEAGIPHHMMVMKL